MVYRVDDEGKKVRKNEKRSQSDEDFKKAKVTPTRLGFLKSRHPLFLSA
jgi:hypothetical protein